MKKITLYFDEPTHKYTDEEGNVYTSTTTLIGEFSPEFKTMFWAVYRALDQKGYRIRPDKNLVNILVYDKDDLFNKWKPYTIDELYNGAFIAPEERDAVLGDWKQLCDAGCDWGSVRHDYLEDCVNAFYKGGVSDREAGTVADLPQYDKRTASFRLKIVDKSQLENSPLTKSHPAVYKLLVQLVNKGFILYAEKRIYSYEYKVSGTIDLLAVRGKDFYIIDWKTNKGEINFLPGYFKKAWNKDRTLKVKTKEWISNDERFKTPISHITYCKGHIYALQLSIYAYLCEMWGLNCLGLILCHIRHKEDVKVNYTNTHDGRIRDGLKIKKKEIAPRIYPKMPYFKDEVKTLFDHHLNVNINGNKPKGITTRKPINLKQ